MPFPDHFSPLASAYARHRPTYPEALFDHLAALAPGRQRAWDAATGSGQAAVALAERFAEVVASDGSLAQLASARRVPGVHYLRAVSEASPLAGRSVELVTVAQALHWFDLDRFYAEVHRVLRPRGVFAAWTYDLLTVGPDVDPVLRWFAEDLVGPFWPPERAHVAAGYRDLPFPFAPLPVPPLVIEADWGADELQGYLATWSAVRRYREETGQDPVELLREPLAEVWGTAWRRRVTWPLAVRAGRLG